MSIQQLEQNVRELSAEELAQFCAWFDTYRTTFDPAEPEEPGLSPDQRAEIDSRLDALDADPSLAVPWEGTIDKVLPRIRAELRARRTQKNTD